MKTLHKIFWCIVIFGLGVLTLNAWYAYIFEEKYGAFFPALVLLILTSAGVALWKDLTK